MKKSVMIMVLLAFASGCATTGCKKQEAAPEMRFDPPAQEKTVEPLPVKAESIKNESAKASPEEHAVGYPMKEEAVAVIVAPSEKAVKVKVGSVSMDAPKTMVMGKKSRVTVRVTDRPPDKESPEGPRRALVTPKMKASLSGDGFEFEPLSPPIQMVDGRLGATEWQWNVSPTRSGTLSLEAKVSMIIGDVEKEIPSVVETISVQATASAIAKKVASGYEKYIMPSVAGSGITAALVAWLFKRKKRIDRR